MSVEIFGTNRDDIQSKKYNKLKLKAGEELRAGIVFHDNKGLELFKGTKVHYHDSGKRTTFMCKSSKENKAICCTHKWSGNAPKFRIGCVLVIYKQVQGKIHLEYMPWVFSEQMYNKIQLADQEFPLVDHDIRLKCTNEDFQNIDIHSCKESIWTKNKANIKGIQAAAAESWELVGDMLGQELSEIEIKELLGIDISTGHDVGEISLDSVIDCLQ